MHHTTTRSYIDNEDIPSKQAKSYEIDLGQNVYFKT